MKIIEWNQNTQSINLGKTYSEVHKQSVKNGEAPHHVGTTYCAWHLLEHCQVGQEKSAPERFNNSQKSYGKVKGTVWLSSHWQNLPTPTHLLQINVSLWGSLEPRIADLNTLSLVNALYNCTQSSLCAIQLAFFYNEQTYQLCKI